jgi:SAM-dependent methyltransferase
MATTPPHCSGRAQRLDDPRRLETQLSEQDLARLLALGGHEDIIDLGSGTGFYTDRVAAFTGGTVYAVELVPELQDHHRARGAPANVRFIAGDMTHLDLPPASADVAVSIATWHETGGVVDLAGLASALRPGGRLVIVDWRKEPEPLEGGPPAHIRFSKEEVVSALAPLFTATHAEDLGGNMFAVVARRIDGLSTPPPR